MKKIIDFFKVHRHAFWWTIGYAIIMYLILNLMFGFDMLSARHWSILAHAHLRGFPGFVFGILVLAAVPLYVATTTLIIKKKEPILKIFSEPEKKEETKNEIKSETRHQKSEINLPPELPPQLRAAFLRAREKMPVTPVAKSASQTNIIATPVIKAPINQKSEIENQQSSALPLPDDFDFGAPSEPAAPMFQEISFGTPPPPPPQTITPTSASIIHKNGFSIATHDDTDFWIADDDSWFAAGKTKKSPVADAIAAAAESGEAPALLLLADNIDDIDAKISMWESAGVKIIRNIDEI